MTDTVYVLDRNRNASRHLSPWLTELSLPHHIVDAPDLDWQPPDDAGLLVSVQHFCAPEVSILRRVTAENRVPVLIQADGILEYRNTWEHPAIPPAAIYQPVLGHKIACIGRSQVRVLESWGNVGKCETVGIPRLAPVESRPTRSMRNDGSWRVLVATAKCPAFTPEQHQRVRASLVDLQSWFERHPKIDGRTIDVKWRLTGNLEREIGLAARSICSPQTDLPTALAAADAVITTPSTLMLEAMLDGLPTALLDYTNSPAYVPAAWSITAPEHLETVITELARPPEPKRRFQEMVLHDALECRGSSVARMVRLAEEMTACGRRARERGESLQLPMRILEGDAAAVKDANRSATDWDRSAMEVELAHLQELVRRQTAELARVAESLPRRMFRGFTKTLGRRNV